MINRLCLSGSVQNTPLHKISPSGIPHCQFVLEHLSVQKEAGFYRKAWCQVPVIISGANHQEITSHIKVGVQIVLEGFINLHSSYSGQKNIVLHAEHIKFIN